MSTLWHNAEAKQFVLRVELYIVTLTIMSLKCIKICCHAKYRKSPEIEAASVVTQLQRSA